MPLLFLGCGYTALQLQAKEYFFNRLNGIVLPRPLDFSFSKNKRQTIHSSSINNQNNEKFRHDKYFPKKHHH